MTAAPIEGRMLDCDGHLYMEPDVMAEIVGDAGGELDHRLPAASTSASDADHGCAHQARDDTWTIKGISARSARATSSRVDALDTMGIHRQLVFPNTRAARAPHAHAGGARSRAVATTTT